MELFYVEGETYEEGLSKSKAVISFVLKENMNDIAEELSWTKLVIITKIKHWKM